MVLVPLSGGWKSAYLLIHWLRTNTGKCAAFHAGLPGDRYLTRRISAYAAIRAYVEMNWPGRVQWMDCNISGVMPWDGIKTADLLGMIIGWIMRSSQADIGTVITPVEIGIDKRKLKVKEVVAAEAKAEIPESTFRSLFVCENGPLPCGNCAACHELDRKD